MAKAFPLDLLSADGSVVSATAHISTTPIPGGVWRYYTVRVEWPGGEAAGTGCDAFYALRAARERLDEFGLIPRCYGACRNFVMSGMASQMGGGMAGHLVTPDRPAGEVTVMTFEAGPDMDVVSVAEQDAFKEAWLASLRPRPNPTRQSTRHAEARMADARSPNSSPAPLNRPVPRWPRRLAAVAWAGWAAAVASLWGQYQIGVYDTLDWLWLPFEAVSVMAGLIALPVGLVRVIVGPRRQAAFGWAVLGLTPILLSAAVEGYMFYEQGRKNLPNTHVHKIGRMAAVTLLKAHARLRYPHRFETDRLVMYHDDRVTDPAADAAAMDAHLARLEETLGRRQHSRIHWVRGPSLGMHAMSIHSVALASETGPAGWFDRHELAHSFLYQFSDPGAEPPMLLLEGWAMAVDGHPEPLAATARLARAHFTEWRGTPTCLRSILAPDLYHVGIGYAYDLGGALADFLLRRYGAEKFLAFYNGVRPESFDADCERVFGLGIDALEREFWADVEER